MVFACVFVLVGLDLSTHVYHVCMMYYSYSTSSRYSTCTCITVCTIYMYHVVVPVHYVWWYTTHTYRTVLLISSFLSRMEKGVCQQLNFEKR